MLSRVEHETSFITAGSGIHKHVLLSHNEQPEIQILKTLYYLDREKTIMLRLSMGNLVHAFFVSIFRHKVGFF